MKHQYQSMYLLTLLLFFLMMLTTRVLAEEKIEAFSSINVAPVIWEDLEEVRGLGGVDVTGSTSLVAVLSDNDATNNITGYNTIGEGSFNEASGVFSIIQNTGNNVIIQDSTIITVTITPN